MTTIAIEEHWTTQELADALRALPADRRDDSLPLNDMGDNLDLLHDLGETRLAMMDAQGVDVQILSLAPPATGPLSGPDAVAFSRDLNDQAFAAVARHPDRFRAFATLPLSEPGAAASELERARGLGAVGVMVYGRTGDRPLDDPAYYDVLGAAAALGTPVFIHPQIPSRALREAAYSGFDDLTSLALSTFGWGWHVEAATAALRLIVSGAFDRHPDLQVVLGHWGELLLFWLDRIDGLSRVAGLERRASDYVRSNMHITSSGMLSPALLQHALAATSVDRLMFSTDFPFQRPTSGEIDEFLTGFPDDDSRAAFLGGNAARLFAIS
ncbi:amidohydrolase family protein [Frondihabitans australicus]|nr:amidohydrolase family protein [Frondihabitans australicus]